MFCTKCGTEIKEGNSFCTSCGSPIEGAQAGLGATAPMDNVTTVRVAAPAGANMQAKGAGSGKATIVIAIVVALVVLVSAAVVAFWVLSPEQSKESVRSASLSADLDETGDPSSSSSSGTVGTDYILPDSNTRLYAADELASLSDWELYIARNEIFARYGRGFKNADLVEYFSAQPWYSELYTPEEFDAMPSPLNDIERDNSELMRSIEEARGSAYLNSTGSAHGADEKGGVGNSADKQKALSSNPSVIQGTGEPNHSQYADLTGTVRYEFINVGEEDFQKDYVCYLQLPSYVMVLGSQYGDVGSTRIILPERFSEYAGQVITINAWYSISPTANTPEASISPIWATSINILNVY